MTTLAQNNSQVEKQTMISWYDDFSVCEEEPVHGEQAFCSLHHVGNPTGYTQNMLYIQQYIVICVKYMDNS